MKVAVVGATGLVGQTMLRVLEERGFPIDQIIPVASERSKGKFITFKGEKVPVILPREAVLLKPDLALFSAGSEISLDWAENFADVGTYVIDNSSAWRMDSDKKLVVPEVNGECLSRADKIIANPNCSTIQLVVVLKPLLDAYGIERVIVSTYQSVTGSGQKGVDQLLEESQNLSTGQSKAYPHPIYQNVLPQIDVFQENGYTKEEMKMILESQKILGQPLLKITATAVRVPVMGGHSESVTIELKKSFQLSDLRQLLEKTKGIIVLDKPSDNIYPMPLTAEGKDEVFVGRLRKDLFQENILNCWIVADNLRKGAATNAIQIAEYLLQKGWL